MVTVKFRLDLSEQDFEHLVSYLAQDARAFQVFLTGLVGADEAERMLDDYQQFLKEALAQFETIFTEGE